MGQNWPLCLCLLMTLFMSPPSLLCLTVTFLPLFLSAYIHTSLIDFKATVLNVCGPRQVQKPNTQTLSTHAHHCSGVKIAARRGQANEGKCPPPFLDL